MASDVAALRCFWLHPTPGGLPAPGGGEVRPALRCLLPLPPLPPNTTSIFQICEFGASVLRLSRRDNLEVSVMRRLSPPLRASLDIAYTGGARGLVAARSIL